jgi:hypothetical protein
MLVSELLSSSLRKIGALSSGETIEVVRQIEALHALQSLLRSWGAISNNVFASIKENVSLVPGQSEYTWGASGNISSARPNQVTGAYVLDISGVTHPVDIITEGKYRSISVKGTTSRPFALYFHAEYPLAKLYLYPTPDSAEVLYLDSYKPFTETSSFGLTTDTLVFPGYYEEPMIYNLAIRLAPEYGKAVSADVSSIAKSSYLTMTTLNAANHVEQLYILVPASSPYGARYSINSDSYH